LQNTVDAQLLNYSINYLRTNINSPLNNRPMFINVTRSGNVVTGSLNGQPFGVTYNEERYAVMQALAKKSLEVSTMEELNEIFAEFEPLTKESYKELAETVCPYIQVNNATGKFFLSLNGETINTPLPKALVDRILKSIEDGIDFLPLIKLSIRFLRNQVWRKGKKAGEAKFKLLANYVNRKYTDPGMFAQLKKDGLSDEVAKNLATGFQTPITQEGLLVTYKVSEELTKKWTIDAEGNKKQVPRYDATVDENTGVISYDTPKFVEDRTFIPAFQKMTGDEFFCEDLGGIATKGHLIKVGHRHYLESWDQVECTDGIVAQKGLHAGNLDYIRGYQQPGTVTHNIFIDPAMIGRFTDEGDGAVICKEYFVYGSFAGVNKSIYHSSAYGKITDAEYEKMLEETLKEFDEKIEDKTQSAKEAKLIASTELS
jgi:hypothetical protein